jgi:hypothetical protein
MCRSTSRVAAAILPEGMLLNRSVQILLTFEKQRRVRFGAVMGPMDALSALERSTDFAVADRSTLERLAAQMV